MASEIFSQLFGAKFLHMSQCVAYKKFSDLGKEKCAKMGQNKSWQVSGLDLYFFQFYIKE